MGSVNLAEHHATNSVETRACEGSFGFSSANLFKLVIVGVNI